MKRTREEKQNYWNENDRLIFFRNFLGCFLQEKKPCKSLDLNRDQTLRFSVVKIPI